MRYRSAFSGEADMQRGRVSGTRSVLASVVLLAALASGCEGGPFLVFPGGALSGEVVEVAPPDWSFADDTFLDLETRPARPYSVELNYVVKDGQLFIDPAEGRTWFDHIREDPRVRVRFGDKVYAATAVLVGKPGELEDFPADRFVYRLDFRIP